MNNKKINFQKFPYRGIFAEIAKEHGVSPQAVRQAVVVFQSPRYLELFNQKVAQRKYAKRNYEKLVG